MWQGEGGHVQQDEVSGEALPAMLGPGENVQALVFQVHEETVEDSERGHSVSPKLFTF